jgi:glycosyltransferase involved in cell wall biosynthesis
VTQRNGAGPIRLAYVIGYYRPAYAYGGPVRSVSALCESLARLGADVTVLTTDANAGKRLDVPLRQPENVDGVQVIYYPLSGLPPRSYFHSPELAAACAQNAGRFDIVFLDTLFAHAMGPAASACRKAGVPYVMPLRGQLLPWALRYKRLKKSLFMRLAGRRYLNNAAALYCTDASEARAAVALGLRPPAFVVPNGVDAARFSDLPPRGALRRRLGIPQEAIVLLLLGRLHGKKRPDIAVEALAAARRTNGETHLILAGHDEQAMAASLRAQAERLGCAGHLHIAGLLPGDEVKQALADSDLLLMPSEPASENFGMAAVEALAAGVPVVASTGVPVAERAASAGAGLVAPGSAQAFAQAVSQALARPEELRCMGRRGRELARQEFDLPVVAGQMLAHCRQIISNGRPDPAPCES